MVTFPEREFATPLLAEIAAVIVAEDGTNFNEHAAALSAWHRDAIPFCAQLCTTRSNDDPSVSTEAFKRIEMHASPDNVVHRFATSGTSSGEDRRGKVGFSTDDLALMDRAILINAANYLFPDIDARRTRILVLAPSPEMAPQMIMAYGMNRIREAFGTPESCFLAGPKGLDIERLLSHLEAAMEADEAVTLIGASFGFVHLLDAFESKGIRFQLPKHSRVMDAGGFKGRTREVNRDDLVRMFGEYLNVAPSHCVNLLGLTELASQFYDDTLAAYYVGRTARRGKQNPPWTETCAVDPETLRVLPHDEHGMLRHTDLANGGHPYCVQTDDIGYTTDEGFVILGRAKGSGARGCSLSVDELLARAEASA